MAVSAGGALDCGSQYVEVACGWLLRWKEVRQDSRLLQEGALGEK